MSKTIMSSMLLALAVAFTLNLHAEPAWTTASCAPVEWQPLDGNILLNVTGTSASVGATGYDSSDLAVLTNGSVPTSTSENKGGIFGFKNGENISWTFAAPKTIEQIRICTCYLSSTAYDGVHIAKVEVMFFGESSWTQVAGESQYNGESSAGKINYTVLTNGEDPVVQNIIGLRITFGTCETGFANYYAEIEAVGFAGATGPVIGAFAIAPAKTKATVSGTIADPGTDATACDVYLSLDGGEATKIAEDVTGAFEYLVQGLTAGTTYTYELTVSNNAPTARGTVQSGDFTTLASDASTMLWTSEDIAPDDWVALANNILAGKVGVKTAGAIAGTNYATDDSSVLTDGNVPKTGGAAYIYGFQNGCTMEWTLDKAISIESLRLSAAYLAGASYSKLAVGSVSVKISGSDEWTPLDAPAFSDIAGRSSGVLICATLSDIETGVLAENVAGIKIVFGNVDALGSYVAEIEAVGHGERKNGVIVLVR